jgi:hypothetical protein
MMRGDRKASKKIAAKDVGFEARTRHAEQLVDVVELDAELDFSIL